MKRKLVTATMAAMMMVSTAVPALAVVGAKKPESPDMMVITAIQPKVEKRISDAPVQPLPEPVLYDQVIDPERVSDVKAGDQRWYTVDPSQLMRVTGMVNQYTIKKGDTLWKITQKRLQTEDVNQIKAGVDQLVNANRLQNPDLIYPGQTLNFPVK